VGLYTRRQLLLLFALAAAAGLGLGLGHWRARHPLAAERLESMDRASAPLAGRAPVSPAPSPPDSATDPAARTDASPGPPESRADAAEPPAAPGPGPSGEREPGNAPLDINRAPREALMRLPGVGPALAARIVEARRDGGPFVHVDDLRRVRGVGPSRLERLRALVNVEGSRDVGASEHAPDLP
jgi:competence ComEA-like helix-hairpin-helix protein